MAFSDEFEQWSENCMVCTDFAAEYKRENPDATIKFGKTKEGTEHAWVYDPEQDATIDATLGQVFDPEYEDDYWQGENHPLADAQEDFETVEDFAKGPGGNYLLD